MTSKEVVKELRKEIDKVLQTGKSLRSYRIYQYLDMLEKDNPTLSECIKEWEELQCDVIVWESQERYEISNRDETIYFEILTIGNNYVVDNRCCEFVKPPVIHLLSKTLKALEEMKDEKEN